MKEKKKNMDDMVLEEVMEDTVKEKKKNMDDMEYRLIMEVMVVII